MAQRQRHQSHRRTASGRAASARAFAGGKDEMESAGALEVGELLTIKTKDLDTRIENRFAALQSLDQDGLPTEKTMDFDSYIDNRISKLLSHDPSTVAPGALMNSTPKTFTPPKAAFTFTSSPQALLLAIMKTTSFSDLTKAATATNLSTPEKSTPVIHLTTKRIKAATWTKGTSSVRTTQQQDLPTTPASNSNPPLPSSKSSTTSSLSALIASILPGANAPPHTPNPTKGWPTSHAIEPMAPATKNRKSRFYPTSSTHVPTAAASTSVAAVELNNDTAGWTVVTSPKKPNLKRNSAPAALTLAPLPDILLQYALDDNVAAPSTVRVCMPVPWRPVGDVSRLWIKTRGFVRGGGVGAEVSGNADVMDAVTGEEGKGGAVRDEGWGGQG